MTTVNGRENTPPPRDLMAALRSSLDQAKREREQRQIALVHIAAVHHPDRSDQSEEA